MGAFNFPSQRPWPLPPDSKRPAHCVVCCTYEAYILSSVLCVSCWSRNRVPDISFGEKQIYFEIYFVQI
jgi:hypothetical protein